MELVLITALGVGGATVFGSVLGFIFKKITHKANDIILSFAAGVMLAAAVMGLIIPSIELGGKYGLLITISGIFVGALCLLIIDKITPHLHRMIGYDFEDSVKNIKLNKVLLFVIAIAIHNLPEGFAAGVSFGGGDISRGIVISLSIAFQNIPEGMIIIAPLLAAGVSKGKTFVIALITGLIEVVGTLIGFFAVSVVSYILPFALAFAGGSMLYIVSDEMIPETHSHGSERFSTFSLLAGFCLMIVFDTIFG